MKKTLFFVCLFACVSACAQVKTILGEWKTVDDKTGDNYSVVNIYKASNGLYYGKIAKILMGPEDVLCTQCEGADHNVPMAGLVIIRAMHYNENKNQLEGGKVLDPLSGKFYYGKIYPKDGKLVLRGSLDRHGILGRNQTWVRK